MDIFVKRPTLALVISAAILLAGLFAVRSIPVLQFPQIESTSLQITTAYFGASAEVVESPMTMASAKAAMVLLPIAIASAPLAVELLPSAVDPSAAAKELAPTAMAPAARASAPVPTAVALVWVACAWLPNAVEPSSSSATVAP